MIVKDQLLDSIKPEHQKEWRLKVNEAENFFKHADRDHASTLDFSPEQSEILIFDAIHQYCLLTAEKPTLFALYFGWFAAENPGVFLSMPEDIRQAAERTKHMGKTRFFEAMLPVVTRRGT